MVTRGPGGPAAGRCPPGHAAQPDPVRGPPGAHHIVRGSSRGPAPSGADRRIAGKPGAQAPPRGRPTGRRRLKRGPARRSRVRPGRRRAQGCRRARAPTARPGGPPAGGPGAAPSGPGGAGPGGGGARPAVAAAGPSRGRGGRPRPLRGRHPAGYPVKLAVDADGDGRPAGRRLHLALGSWAPRPPTSWDHPGTESPAATGAGRPGGPPRGTATGRRGRTATG